MVFRDAAECLFLIVIAQEMVQYYRIGLLIFLYLSDPAKRM